MNTREITSMLTADQIFRLGVKAADEGYNSLQAYAADILRNAAQKTSEKQTSAKTHQQRKIAPTEH